MAAARCAARQQASPSTSRPTSKSHSLSACAIHGRTAIPRPNSTRQAAETSYGVLLSPKEGFQKKAQIDMEGVRTALLLRSKYGLPKKTLTDPTPYYDASFHTEAMKRAR